MAVYAVAIIPLILMLLKISSNNPIDSVKEIANADDLAAGGKIDELRTWWRMFITLGPKFGYFP